ncbi:MAG: prolipoprotein diacylglyceryl transferase [Candidatus Moraniibacteriota bacterium]
MPSFWQVLPLTLDPVAGHIAGLPVTWYAIMYILGALFSALYFVVLAKKQGILMDASVSIEVIVSILWGVLIGARLGYVFFYGGNEFLREPWRIISPYDFGIDQWIGIRGMSFHGGLVGGAVGLFMFTREAKREFLRFADVLVQAVPIAIFFGRIGNFLNQEIMGRAVTGSWGMYFPATDQLLLHPVTLYEAAFEGLFLFIVMFILGRITATPGRLTAFFLFLYAGIRYLAEGYRAIPLPEDLVLGYFSVGQALSLALVVLGLVILILPRRRVV